MQTCLMAIQESKDVVYGALFLIQVLTRIDALHGCKFFVVVRSIQKLRFGGR